MASLLVITQKKKKVCHTQTNVNIKAILVYDCDSVILTYTVVQRQSVDAQYFRHFLE